MFIKANFFIQNVSTSKFVHTGRYVSKRTILCNRPLYCINKSGDFYPIRKSHESAKDVTCTGLSKRNGAKLRESFCPTAASHSWPRQAGA